MPKNNHLAKDKQFQEFLKAGGWSMVALMSMPLAISLTRLEHQNIFYKIEKYLLVFKV